MNEVMGINQLNLWVNNHRGMNLLQVNNEGSAPTQTFI